MNSLYKQMVIKTNRALVMLGNHSEHHNTEIKTFSPCGYINNLNKNVFPLWIHKTFT